MNVKGRVLLVLPEQTGTSAKGAWKKKEFVIETAGQYPKKIHLTLFGKAADAIHPRVGDEMDCSIDISSREYNGRWYTEINCYKAEGFTGNLGTKPAEPQHPILDSSTDELPF